MRKFIEILFYTFPISFILGNLAVTLYTLIFIIASLFFIRKERLVSRFRNSYWILIIFFLYISLLTIIHYQDIEILRTLLYQDPGLLNTKTPARSLEDNSIFKSLLLLRYVVLIFVIDTLFFNKILNLKKFFLFSLLCTSFVSLDIIVQYIFGFDLFGFKGGSVRNSGPFGDEMIAGGYLQRFFFFSLFSIFVIFEKKNFKNPLLIFFITIHSAAIFLAGNKMPLLLFIFGCFLIIMFFKNLRIIMSLGMIGFLAVFIILYKSNTEIHGTYKNFLGNILPIFGGNIERQVTDTSKQEQITDSNKVEKKETKPFFLRGSGHPYIYYNAILVWQKQPLFGFGLKSFRIKCWENLTNNTMMLYTKNTNKLYLACANHAHNYYLEFLSETGIIGFILMITFFIILWKDFFHYFIKYKHKINSETILLVPIVITLFLEIWPLKSTGSFFTNWTATFFWLTTALLFANKTKRSI